MQPNKTILFSMLAFQFVILVGMVSNSMYPLLFGQEIKMKVRPLDPRDLMRGNYVRLTYDFNSLSLEKPQPVALEGTTEEILENAWQPTYVENHLNKDKTYNYGQVVYVELKENKGYYEPVALWESKPSNNKIYLKTSVDHHSTGYSISLSSGVEDFYTDAKQAKALEVAMRDEATRNKTYAVVKVAKNGMARLISVKHE